MSRLATARYRLSPLAPGDRRDLFAHLSDPATVEHLDIAPMADLEAADAMIAWAGALPDNGSAWWAIRDGAGDFVGTAGLIVTERRRGSRGEVSYNVVRPRWRREFEIPLQIGHARARNLTAHFEHALVVPEREIVV